MKKNMDYTKVDELFEKMRELLKLVEETNDDGVKDKHLKQIQQYKKQIAIEYMQYVTNYAEDKKCSEDEIQNMMLVVVDEVNRFDYFKDRTKLKDIIAARMNYNKNQNDVGQYGVEFNQGELVYLHKFEEEIEQFFNKHGRDPSLEELMKIQDELNIPVFSKTMAEKIYIISKRKEMQRGVYSIPFEELTTEERVEGRYGAEQILNDDSRGILPLIIAGYTYDKIARILSMGTQQNVGQSIKGIRKKTQQIKTEEPEL